jgi:hypothetical protein
VIYATVDLAWLAEGPQPGEIVDYDLDQGLDGMAFFSMGNFGW